MSDVLNSSILGTIRNMLGPTDDYTYFDSEIVVHINTFMLNLTQIGVGPKTGYSITGDEETWGDYLGDTIFYEPVKTYLYLKVKMIFDPPASSSVAEAMQRTCDEIEWRLKIQAEHVEGGDSDDGS